MTLIFHPTCSYMHIVIGHHFLSNAGMIEIVRNVTAAYTTADMVITVHRHGFKSLCISFLDGAWV